MLRYFHVALFHVTLFPCFAFSNVQMSLVSLFFCCHLLMLHFLRVELFPYCTFFMLHSFNITLFLYRSCLFFCNFLYFSCFLPTARFSCFTFFVCRMLFMSRFSVLHSFHVLQYSRCTFFVLHPFHVALFSNFTLFLLNFFHVALFRIALILCCFDCVARFSCWTFVMLHLCWCFESDKYNQRFQCTIFMLHSHASIFVYFWIRASFLQETLGQLPLFQVLCNLEILLYHLIPDSAIFPFFFFFQISKWSALVMQIWWSKNRIKAPIEYDRWISIGIKIVDFFSTLSINLS